MSTQTQALPLADIPGPSARALALQLADAAERCAGDIRILQTSQFKSGNVAPWLIENAAKLEALTKMLREAL